MSSDRTARRVLIADDLPAVAESLCLVVHKTLGCEVATCEDGDSALRLLAENPYDVLVTDMQMPGCHGLELVRRAKELQPACDLIVMTGYPSSFPYMEAIQAGAADFMAKPFLGQELCARLVRLFAERDVRERLNGADRYGLFFERNLNAMLVIQARELRIEDANPEFSNLCGQERDILLGHSFASLLAPADQHRLQLALEAMVHTGGGTLGDVGIRHADGTERALDLSLTFVEHGAEELLLLVCKDVTEQRDLRERLLEIATTDDLTGLFNRRAFYGRVAMAIDWANGQQKPLAMVFIDLDNFKRCNDTHGHQVGDVLLERVGALIRRQIRSEDEGFRYGGDEFAVLLRGATPLSALHAAERIRRAFESEERYGTSMSLGVAMYSSGMSAEDFVRAADTALYQAKASGKNATSVA